MIEFFFSVMVLYDLQQRQAQFVFIGDVLLLFIFRFPTGVCPTDLLFFYLKKTLDTCRKLVLDFFRRLPATYEAHTLILYRKQLLRPLSTACGDPVREVRRVALAARQSWENLA